MILRPLNECQKNLFNIAFSERARYHSGLPAGMVELVDTSALGADARKSVEVRVLFPAQNKEPDVKHSANIIL